MGNREFAQKLMNQAVEAATKKINPSDLTTAYQLWASACVADPTYGESWYSYSNNNFDIRKLEAAVAGYRRALHCDLPADTRARAMLNMGWFGGVRRWPKRPACDDTEQQQKTNTREFHLAASSYLSASL